MVVNAKAPDSGRSPFWTLILGFGPTILLVGLFVYFARRMAAGGAPGRLRALAGAPRQPRHAERG